MIDLGNEPELEDMFEEKAPPAWVISAIEGAIATDIREAAAWSDALALALGRRSNRMLRERYGMDAREE